MVRLEVPTGFERRTEAILAERLAERGMGEGDGPRVVVGTPAGSPEIAEAVAHGLIGPIDDLGDEGFHIQPDGDRVLVVASAPRGLLFGVGEFLRRSRFGESSWTGPEEPMRRVPAMPVRQLYFATHFGNWYCHADEDELRRYIEDLALWGYNELVTWFDLHHYRNFDEGRPVWDRLVMLERLARDLGLRVGRVAIANESFAGQGPAEYGARGRLPGSGYTTDLCPSIREARAMILENRRGYLELVRATTELDWICWWPYDQGGCNCERCTPWPSTFLDLCRELDAMTREVLPQTESIVSAWWIGTHVAGEDEDLFSRLERGEDWFQTILAGTVEVRRWLAAGRRLPAQYRLLLFPEISMFDSLPWGGRGANPAPRRFETEYADLRPHIAGAMPYSEGRYEDVNKAIWGGLMWQSEPDVEESVRQYCRYHFGAAVEEEATRLVFDVEAGLRDMPSAGRREAAAAEIEARMPAWARSGWRWRMLRVHTRIDALKAQLEDPSTGEADAAQLRKQIREPFDELQLDLNRHDPERSLLNWIYMPFSDWVELPFNELVLPTGAG